MKKKKPKNIDNKLIAKLQAAVDAAALEIAQTIENPKTESIDVNAWYFTANGEEEKLRWIEVEITAAERCRIPDEEAEIIWENIPFEVEFYDRDCETMWCHIKGFGSEPPEDNADLTDDRTETLAFASPGDWEEKIISLTTFMASIDAAIADEARAIYMDADYEIYRFQPAEPHVLFLADLEGEAYINDCKISELDADVIISRILDGMVEEEFLRDYDDDGQPITPQPWIDYKEYEIHTGKWFRKKFKNNN
ncbi:MAG: hypothetical protein LUE08_07065 [Akkermansiaceae bacterium]|nr:hypothetical protein [Akkermansiaceae bacterium]